MKEINRPRPAAASPLTREPREAAAMAVIPQMASIRNSGGPKARMERRITGMSRIKKRMPKVEPRAEERAEQAMAVPRDGQITLWHVPCPRFRTESSNSPLRGSNHSTRNVPDTPLKSSRIPAPV